MSFIQNKASAGAGGAVFLTSGTLIFNGNVVFKENVVSGFGVAVYCSSRSIIFSSYVATENNESSSLGVAIYSRDVVLKDGGYFVDNKAKLGWQYIYPAVLQLLKP
ncbi:MAG: hypothetical protein LBS61_00955 [Endomicrobium sp.]|nr:hypothetical protein [Endomicrobium sp.]